MTNHHTVLRDPSINRLNSYAQICAMIEPSCVISESFDGGGRLTAITSVRLVLEQTDFLLKHFLDPVLGHEDRSHWDPQLLGSRRT
jgi:hypothetical protein